MLNMSLVRHSVTPMTFIYELDPYYLEIYQMGKMNFVRQHFESYRLTDNHTESTDITKHAASRVLKNR